MWTGQICFEKLLVCRGNTSVGSGEKLDDNGLDESHNQPKEAVTLWIYFEGKVKCVDEFNMSCKKKKSGTLSWFWCKQLEGWSHCWLSGEEYNYTSQKHLKVQFEQHNMLLDTCRWSTK